MNKVAKGTRTKLTQSDVLDMRRYHDEEGMDDAHIGRIFSVSRATVYDVVNRRTWAHVPDPVPAKGYKGYRVYPDGRIYSEASKSFMATVKGNITPSVRLKAPNGKRRTVSVATLVNNSYRN